MDSITWTTTNQPQSKNYLHVNLTIYLATSTFIGKVCTDWHGKPNNKSSSLGIQYNVCKWTCRKAHDTSLRQMSRSSSLESCSTQHYNRKCLQDFNNWCLPVPVTGAKQWQLELYVNLRGYPFEGTASLVRVEGGIWELQCHLHSAVLAVEQSPVGMKRLLNMRKYNTYRYIQYAACMICISMACICTVCLWVIYAYVWYVSTCHCTCVCRSFGTQQAPLDSNRTTVRAHPLLLIGINIAKVGIKCHLRTWSKCLDFQCANQRTPGS